MKDKIIANRITIIVATLVIIFTVLCYLYPSSFGLGSLKQWDGSTDCNSPLFYPDPNDRRGLRPACGTSY
jgi:hypothetical protein